MTARPSGACSSRARGPGGQLEVPAGVGAAGPATQRDPRAEQPEVRRCRSRRPPAGARPARRRSRRPSSPPGRAATNPSSTSYFVSTSRCPLVTCGLPACADCAVAINLSARRGRRPRHGCPAAASLRWRRWPRRELAAAVRRPRRRCPGRCGPALRLTGTERGFPLVPAMSFTPYAAATRCCPLARGGARAVRTGGAAGRRRRGGARRRGLRPARPASARPVPDGAAAAGRDGEPAQGPGAAPAPVRRPGAPATTSTSSSVQELTPRAEKALRAAGLETLLPSAHVMPARPGSRARRASGAVWTRLCRSTRRRGTGRLRAAHGAAGHRRRGTTVELTAVHTHAAVDLAAVRAGLDRRPRRAAGARTATSCGCWPVTSTRRWTTPPCAPCCGRGWADAAQRGRAGTGVDLAAAAAAVAAAGPRPRARRPADRRRRRRPRARAGQRPPRPRRRPGAAPAADRRCSPGAVRLGTRQGSGVRRRAPSRGEHGHAERARDVRRRSASTAYGADGGKLGTVEAFFVDDRTGAPTWVAVSTGLFGTRHSIVPAADATFTDGALRLPVTADAVKSAPPMAGRPPGPGRGGGAPPALRPGRRPAAVGGPPSRRSSRPAAAPVPPVRRALRPTTAPRGDDRARPATARGTRPRPGRRHRRVRAPTAA